MGGWPPRHPHGSWRQASGVERALALAVEKQREVDPLLQCSGCGGKLDLTMSSCPACGAEVPLGRLTGILGLVCRKCDAYNDPGTRACVACGNPLGAMPEVPGVTPLPGAPAVVAASPGPPVLDPVAGRTPAAAGAGSPRPRGPATPPEPARGRTHVCPSCGAEHLPSATFCASCGRPLSTVRTAIPAPSPQAPLSPPPSATAPTGTAMFTAQPAPAPRAKLVVERGEAAAGTVFALSADEVQAGRTQGAVIFPADPSLAPHHATFLAHDGRVVVRDEGAPGGLFLAVPTGQAVPLRPGGLFALGDRLLRYAGTLPGPPPPPPDGTLRLGAPRPEAPAVLLEEWLEGGVCGRVHLRSGPSVTIGRAGCTINLGDDPYLSQAHVELAVAPDGGATLRDLGSSNGTFLRLAPGGEAELKNGDALRMGREVLRVELR